jgi:mono/diheme cytochrome c family protein
MRALGGFLLGVLVTLVIVVGGVWGYLRWGTLPVSTSDKPFPLEAQIVHVPMRARIAHDMQQPPFAANEQVYQAGAQIYAQECASCHGAPGHDSDFAQWMYPRAPQLWKKHGKNNVVGVSDDDPGETYWKVKNGIRLTGMPAFQHVLSEEQMWDVTLLLKSADQPKSPQVWATLTGTPQSAMAAPTTH